MFNAQDTFICFDKYISSPGNLILKKRFLPDHPFRNRDLPNIFNSVSNSKGLSDFLDSPFFLSYQSLTQFCSFNITSCAPPTTMLVEETSVILAVCCN